MFVYILGLFIYIFNVYLQKFSKISIIFKILTSTYLLLLTFLQLFN